MPKNPRPPRYSIDNTGNFYLTDWAEWIVFPCIIISDRADSVWVVECNNKDDLRHAIELRAVESDSNFDVEEVYEWAAESAGDVAYNSFFPKGLHAEKCAGLPDTWLM